MMERLTEEKQIGPFGSLKDKAEAVPGAFGTYDCFYAHMVAVTRLKQYEDTGLTPEDIDVLKKREQGLAELLVNVSCGCAVSYTRLAELSQAEKDGRLVVLPCKVGDIVYDILDGTPYATRVLSFSYFGDHWACRTVSSYPDLEQFGTRIFLAREEAEAALKKREEKDNEAD